MTELLVVHVSQAAVDHNDAVRMSQPAGEASILARLTPFGHGLAASVGWGSGVAELATPLASSDCPVADP
jgi:hypothetical protein